MLVPSAIFPICHLSPRPPIPLPEEEDEDGAESQSIQDGLIEDQQYENEVRRTANAIHPKPEKNATVCI